MAGLVAGSAERFDHLVVANGIFCEPMIPHFEGVEEAKAAGGRLLDERSGEPGRGARQARARDRLREVLVRRRGRGQQGRHEHDRGCSRPVVEGAAQAEGRGELQVPAPDPVGRGPVPLPDPRRCGAGAARSRLRLGEPDGRCRREGGRLAVGASGAGAGARRPVPQHRQGFGLVGHRGLLRARRRRLHLGPTRDSDLPLPGEGWLTVGGACRTAACVRPTW